MELHPPAGSKAMLPPLGRGLITLCSLPMRDSFPPGCNRAVVMQAGLHRSFP